MHRRWMSPVSISLVLVLGIIAFFLRRLIYEASGKDAMTCNVLLLVYFCGLVALLCIPAVKSAGVFGRRDEATYAYATEVRADDSEDEAYDEEHAEDGYYERRREMRREPAPREREVRSRPPRQHRGRKRQDARRNEEEYWDDEFL